MSDEINEEKELADEKKELTDKKVELSPDSQMLLKIWEKKFSSSPPNELSPRAVIAMMERAWEDSILEEYSSNLDKKRTRERDYIISLCRDRIIKYFDSGTKKKGGATKEDKDYFGNILKDMRGNIKYAFEQYTDMRGSIKYAFEQYTIYTEYSPGDDLSCYRNSLLKLMWYDLVDMKEELYPLAEYDKDLKGKIDLEEVFCFLSTKSKDNLVGAFFMIHTEWKKLKGKKNAADITFTATIDSVLSNFNIHKDELRCDIKVALEEIKLSFMKRFFPIAHRGHSEFFDFVTFKSNRNDDVEASEIPYRSINSLKKTLKDQVENLLVTSGYNNPNEHKDDRCAIQ